MMTVDSVRVKGRINSSIGSNTRIKKAIFFVMIPIPDLETKLNLISLISIWLIFSTKLIYLLNGSSSRLLGTVSLSLSWFGCIQYSTRSPRLRKSWWSKVHCVELLNLIRWSWDERFLIQLFPIKPQSYSHQTVWCKVESSGDVVPYETQRVTSDVLCKTL